MLENIFILLGPGKLWSNGTIAFNMTIEKENPAKFIYQLP
jgi:hypothetical protein